MREIPPVTKLTYDQNLEQLILAIAFYNQGYLNHGVMDWEDFASPMRTVAKKMIELHRGNCVIDSNTMGCTFDIPDQLEVEQFEAYIISLKNINGNAKLQNLPKKITDLVTKDISYEDKLLKLNDLISKYNIHRDRSEDFLIANHIDAYYESLFNPNIDDHIKTGIKELDFVLQGGFMIGDYITIAGDTGNFKSTLAYNIALYNALIGNSVMIYSYEITKEQMNRVFVSMLAEIDSMHLKSKNFSSLTKEQMRRLKIDVPQILKTIPLYTYDTNASLTDIKLDALRIRPKLILIDYLQIMPRVHENPTLSLEIITREIKAMAKPDRLNVPIVVLSQFNREGQSGNEGENQTQNKRKLSNLKGASEIEQVSSIVLFTKALDVGSGKYIEINVAKNREGPKGPFKLPVRSDIHTIGTDRILTRANIELPKKGAKK